MTEIQSLPATLWAIISGISLIIVLLALGAYIYYRNWTKVIRGEYDSLADMEAKKAQIEAEITNCRKWLEENKEELLKLESERQQQELLRQELANYQMQLAQEEQKVMDLRKEGSDLQNVVSSLSQDRESMINEKMELERKKAEAEKETKNAEDLLHKAAIDAKQAQTDLDEKHREIRELNMKITEQFLRKEALDEEIRHKEARLQDIERVFKEAHSQYDEVNKNLSDRIREIEGALLSKQNDLSEIEDKIREERLKYSNFREKSIEEENKVRELEARRAMLEEKIDSYSETSDDGHNPYDSIYQLPETFTKTGLNEPITNYEEDQAIEDLKNYLKECNLIFPTRVLKAFHTSLKIADISPLVVMAGISGTGKSELPRRYAEALGMHFLLMAVQPRWDSPQDMFGFYNYLEHRYKATELTRSLVRMDKWNYGNDAEYSDRVLLVLLDEMNLARVEYYFSEFLSKLEIRRSINPDIEGDRRKSEVSLDVGSHIKGLRIPNLYVHNNVLFVGTMNEDESTQTLSDKVIDRANVLRFGRPEKMSPSMPIVPNQRERFLPFSVWRDWHRSDDFLNPRAREEVKGWIEKVNLSLDDIGRPFGYRINQAIFSYIANYPSVNAQNNHRLAFSDQLEQRVLPKLRGLELGAKQECFERILEVIEELGDEELAETYRKSIDPSHVLFSWNGVSRKQDQ